MGIISLRIFACWTRIWIQKSSITLEFWANWQKSSKTQKFFKNSSFILKINILLLLCILVTIPMYLYLANMISMMISFEEVVRKSSKNRRKKFQFCSDWCGIIRNELKTSFQTEKEWILIGRSHSDFHYEWVRASETDFAFIRNNRSEWIRDVRIETESISFRNLHQGFGLSWSVYNSILVGLDCLVSVH